MSINKKNNNHTKKEQENEKRFPDAVRAPEFDPTKWNSDGICVGGEKGWLNVNFCYNTLCGNFGLSWQEAEAGYRLRRKGNTLSLICTECGLNRKLYSNKAVDTMFLHVLKNHLLHEYCPDTECENHRINLYEHFPSGKHSKVKRRYSLASGRVPKDPEKLVKYDYLVRCKACGKRFAAGTPWRLHGERRRKSGKLDGPDYQYPMDTHQFMKIVCNGVGPSSAVDILDCHPEHYYALLHNLADACKFESGRRLMELQSTAYVKNQPYQDNNQCMRLYSDMMQIIIYLNSKKSRTVTLQCLVTATDYNDSFFILAFTPMFIPGKFTREEKRTARADSLKLEAHRDYAHLNTEGTPGSSEITISSRDFSFSVLGLDGHFAISSYGALAHFLVLRKMLSRIHRVIHYVDNENELQMAALTAFSDKIRTRQCDVVSVSISQSLKRHTVIERREADLVKLQNVESAKKYTQKDWLNSDQTELLSLRKKEMYTSVSGLEEILNEAAQAYVQERAEMAENRQNPNERAYVYRKAINKTSPKKKKDLGPTDLDLWVRDPLAPMFEPGRHFLWLTRPRGKPNKDIIDKEVDLYIKGSHQPADTYMNSLRQRASAAERARLVASTRFSAGYVSNARMPKPAISEFILHRFNWNFMRRRHPKKNKDNRYIPRAYDLGLSVPRALTVEDAPTYREKVFDWAEEITEWLGI